MPAPDSHFDLLLQPVFDGIDPARDLLLTPNKRLSRFLTERYDALQDGPAFESVKCLSYNAWLQQLWHEAQFLITALETDSVLLTSLQETLLWRRVVREHSATPALVNEEATAKQAQRAWDLMNEWTLDRGRLLGSARAQQENLCFWNWVDDFERRLQRNAWLCNSQLPPLLVELAEQIEERLPQRIFHYGFEEMTPSRESWFRCLSDRGIGIEELSLSLEHTQCRRLSLADSGEQLQAAARWAWAQLKTNPEQRIAVVVPDLVERRASVERIFRQQFEPQYDLPDNAQHATGFNISAAQSLGSMPMIDAAFKALQCGDSRRAGDGRLSIDHLAGLLHSPFLGLQSEREQRALLELGLRRDREPRLSFYKMQSLANSLAKSDSCTDWAARLAVLGRLQRQLDGQRHPSAWIPVWLELLDNWGWPGQRQLDTLEYQQSQAWQEVLEAFSGLDAVLGKLVYSEALAALQLALQYQDYQAQTVDSPLQILGMLEAAGLPFDAMWIVDLDDENWPPPPRPNPLLSLAVQRDEGLPQSTPEREYEFADRLQRRLAQCCSNIVASHARHKGDKAVSSSPLIESWPELDWQPVAELSYQQRLFASRDIETCLDHVGPRVRNLEAVRGGSQIIKSQSQCPFQSFARFRLHSSDIQQPSQGLSAPERGSLVHHVMEVIWNRLKNHRQLVQMSDTELETLVSETNEQAFSALRRRRFLGDRFLALEDRRLKKLVLEWLHLEKQRPPFKVLMQEKSKTIRLEKLPIRIRYDRVDELEDGSLFVVDYKTGSTNVREWAGERPEEPQVPLYVVANSRRVSAAAYGQLSDGEQSFKGIAADVSAAPGLLDAANPGKMELPAGWENIVAHWRRVLSHLTREFLAGTATVDPKDPLKTCRYCELHALCRIREQFDFDAERDLADEESDDE